MTDNKVVGRNGVAIGSVTPEPVVRRVGVTDGSGYRTYEVHQRERVGESTEKIKPIQLVSDAYRVDPYPLLEVLRENYPIYRDWLSNSYWITKYNDVTSVFSDDANFESRSKLWTYGLVDFGRNFGDELALLEVESEILDKQAALVGQRIVDELVTSLAQQQSINLATDFAGKVALELLAECWAIPVEERENFYALYWRAQRGCSWQSQLQQDGLTAINELIIWFAPFIETRRADPGEDYLSVLLALRSDVDAHDVVVTLLERDHETLHGSLANMWFLLLTHPEMLQRARSEPRLMKLAYLETLRHSPPVLTAHRYARHEVERFGKLIPQGARLVCSAGAANRDPDIFAQADQFIVDRRDLCQREPRGQYRADGLATGIAFGCGKPSIYPAIPEDRPRSRYALTRDIAVEVSMQLSDALPNLQLAAGSYPKLAALTVGEMHTCWNLQAR